MVSRTVIGHSRCLITDRIPRRFGVVVDHTARVSDFFLVMFIFLNDKIPLDKLDNNKKKPSENTKIPLDVR